MKARLPVGDGRFPGPNGLEKRQALSAQGLGHLERRNENVAGANSDAFFVAEGRWRFDALVEHGELLVGGGVVEDRHLSVADHGQLSLLVWIEPAHMNMRHASARIVESRKHYVLDAALRLKV